jgi:TolA-binding protein
MTRSDGDREIVNGLDAVAELAREAVPPMTPLQRMRGFQAVLARTEARRRKRRSLLVALTLSSCGVAAGAAALFLAPGVLHGHRPMQPNAVSGEANPLSYRVDNGEIGDGGYLRSFGGSGVGLLFTEGTELRLAAGARGRLTSVDGQGARFAIEQGEAEINVIPRTGARWLIDAGPFLITVHGTTFTAAWDGEREQLEIRMKHGLVSVSGPVADGKIAVRAGQRLTINVPEREVLLRPGDDAEESAVPGADTAATGATPPPAGSAVEPSVPEAPAAVGARVQSSSSMRSSATRAAVAVRTSAPRSWTAALAAGDFQTILVEAEHRGLRRSLADARSEDLAALADAARYLRRDDVARQALIAQRDRFPQSDRAHEAAFLLGRLTEGGTEGRGGYGDVRALGWYDRYLNEAPSGAYASEALGRKMTATEKLRGIGAARDIAREYLRRFPHGTYAGAARALSETP